MAIDLLNEAIADAKRVKAAALANAKLTLEETFQPTLQRLLHNKLSEEEGGEEEFDEADIDVNYEDEEGGEDIGMASFDAEEEEGGEEEFEEGDEMEDDLELERFLREYDDEEEMMEGDDEEYMEEEYEDEEYMEEEYEDEEEMAEAILRSLQEEGEEDEFSMEEEDEMEDEMSERLFREDDGYDDPASNSELKTEIRRNRRLRKENKQLKSNYNKALRAITTYKKTINEVNLLNAKLMYTTKILKENTLSEKQQLNVLKSFDNTSTLREIKLVFNTLSESFRNKRTAAPAKKKVTEGAASKANKMIKPKQQILDENFVRRMQRLANIKKFED